MNFFFDHAYDLSIADLTFQISCRVLPICRESSDHYRNFIKTGQHRDHKDVVTVQLLLDEMPNLDGFYNIFNAGDTWSLFGDDEKKFIVYRGSDEYSSPLWMAHIDMLNRHVDVYISSPFIIKQEPGYQVIRSPFNYPLDQIISIHFLGSDGFIIHAAGAIYQGKGYVFAGPSGAGKSTISMLLSESEDFTLLSDDRIIIKKSENGFSIYGTPWPGDAGIANNNQAPLQKIFFLEKSEKNMLRELTPTEALEKIMPVVSLPWYDKHLLVNYLDTCGEVLEHTRAYVLSFTSDPASAHELLDMFSG